MLNQHLMNVVNFAVRKVPFELQEDARQEAWLGVLEALPRYDSSRGYNVNTFVHQRALGAVKDFLRREDPATRTHRRLIKLGEAQQLFFEEIDPIVETLASKVPSVLAALLHQDSALTIQRQLNRLNAEERAVIYGTYWRELAPRFLAVELNCTSARVFYLRHRALVKLRRMNNIEPESLCD